VRAIVAERRRRPIATTHELVAVIRQAVPYDKNKHVARRTFQALRMAVNQELEEIDRGVSAAVRHLVPGGRLLCVAFHSIEAEAVEHAVQPLLWRHQLTRIAGPIHPTPREIESNRRSRSAVLTVFERST
jgi:16S rRNA (cytosine1402-N4)-methyltransferase